MEDKILVKRVRENAVIPNRASKDAAAVDLTACLEAAVTIGPGNSVLIPTGIALAVPRGYGAFLFARSGLGIKHGIALSNGVGVVDADYRGEVCVGLHNSSEESYTVNPGDRIAQMAIMPVAMAEFLEAETLSETERGTGGFGSTGK